MSLFGYSQTALKTQAENLAMTKSKLSLRKKKKQVGRSCSWEQELIHTPPGEDSALLTIMFQTSTNLLVVLTQRIFKVLDQWHLTGVRPAVRND